MTEPSPIFYWLLLQQLPGMKPRLLRRLFAADPDCIDPRDWFAWSPTRLRALGVGNELLAAMAASRTQGLASVTAQKAQRDHDWLQQHNVHLLLLSDPRYPSLLLEIADPPPLLYVWGDVDVLSAPQIAVVGSRRASRQGLSDAEAFAVALATSGFAITSGLALGIDAAAQSAALNASGQTVAVLGSGIDTLYPAVNSDLAAAISKQGAVISEFPLGTPPRANQFPSRNRIISGLSLGVLVVEAAMQSGSLVTARLAAEQNREVFALPGSIHNPVSRGCNSLIRQGATLVQSVDDILAELRGWLCPGAEVNAIARNTLPAPAPELDVKEIQVFTCIGFEPISIDEILSVLDQPLPAVLAILADLELMGLIECRGGSYLRVAETCTV